MDGLHAGGKYFVRKQHDPESKHDDCWFFVLDIEHDPHAMVALEAYAESCREEKPQLRFDLLANIRQIRERGGKP